MDQVVHCLDGVQGVPRACAAAHATLPAATQSMAMLSLTLVGGVAAAAALDVARAKPCQHHELGETDRYVSASAADPTFNLLGPTYQRRLASRVKLPSTLLYRLPLVCKLSP
jgi:hypothetical protein